MAKKKDLGGRPTLLTEATIRKLEELFKAGSTVEQACIYANIGKSTYYDWLKADDSFRMKMEKAQYYVDVVAQNIVVDDIVNKKNIDSAKWWLVNKKGTGFGRNNVETSPMPPIAPPRTKREEDLIFSLTKRISEYQRATNPDISDS